MWNFNQVIAGGTNRLYLVWFKENAIVYRLNPAEVVIRDMRSKGAIVWILEHGIHSPLGEDEPYDLTLVEFIMPSGQEWKGVTDYVMSFTPFEGGFNRRRENTLPVNLVKNLPAGDVDGTLHIKVSDLSIYRW